MSFPDVSRLCPLVSACEKDHQLLRAPSPGNGPSARDARMTLAISCEAVPPSVSPAVAQGGTLSRRSGAALSFVSCIALFDDTVTSALAGEAVLRTP